MYSGTVLSLFGLPIPYQKLQLTNPVHTDTGHGCPYRPSRRYADHHVLIKNFGTTNLFTIDGNRCP